MKKFAILCVCVLMIAALASCKQIDSVPMPEKPKNTTSQTLQEESPKAEIIAESESSQPESTVTQETSAPPVSTEKETSSAPASDPVTETEKETAAPVSETPPPATETQKPLETAAAQTQAPATVSKPPETSPSTEVETASVEATAPAASKPAETSAVTTGAPVPSTVTNGYQALNYSTQKAVWISFLEFQSILKGKTKAQFTSSVQAMYDNCKALGINTVYVHARSHSDAFYPSELFPWSKNVTGTLAAAPSFDPFQILVDEAHSRGLSFHAWINPMRGMTDEDIQQLPSSYPMKKWYNDSSKRGTYLVNVKGTWYFSPAYAEVRALITSGAKEIVSKYKVDGLHIDDYFYPTTEASFDRSAFAASGAKSLSQWRLDTVSQMVRELYSGVKSVNSTVLFGVSPQGNMDNNYETQYADVKKWCSTAGYLDYVVPQIYFGFQNKTQPYATCLQGWCDIVTAPGVKLVTGLAPYKIGLEESTGEWKSATQILARQVQVFQQSGQYGGAAFFRYESLFTPASAVSSQVSAERKALVEALK